MASSCTMMSSSAATCLSGSKTSCIPLRGAAGLSTASSGSARLMQVMITRCSSSNCKGSGRPVTDGNPSLQEESVAHPDETGDHSLGSLLAAAPEAINGRMAMVGFVWALVAEKMTGLTVVEQLFNPATSGVLRFAAVVQLFTLASTVPFVRGESPDARGWGPFTGKAERLNGRLAMIGFVALLISEKFLHGPLIH